MLQMIKGCRISDPSLLFESYEQLDTGFAANVDADKIIPLFESFIKLHNARCFVILEIPTNLRENPDCRLHKDVYYLDGLKPASAISFLNAYGQLLVHDGLSSFGIGIHSGGNEMVAGKYNVVTVYTKDKGKYSGFFEAHGIPMVREMKTAWDLFTCDSPGDAFSYTYQGCNIYGLVEHLKQYGLYLAERREDW